jgi:dienelactone hydrolase
MRCFLFALGLIGVACKSSPDQPRASTTPSAPSTAAPDPSSAAARDPLSPDVVAFPSGARTLHGFLYRPLGEGPFPAIVFNHGSEKLPGNKSGQAEFYVKHGFALFVPHRRGQGRSQDAGEYIEDVWAKNGHDPGVFVDELVAQSDDVMSAVAYVRALPFVSAEKVAVAGCSLGGIESLLAAERGTGVVAAVDFAGGAMTWDSNVPLQERMKVAARAAKVPVFFLQAENDFNTAPSKVLSEEMRGAGKPMRVHVFPPNGTTHMDGHGFCAGGEHPPWGDEVLAFLAETMGKRK